MTVDIAKTSGQELIRDLAREVDVLLENFKTGTMERYNLDPQELMAENPRLIVCSISGYGAPESRAIPGIPDQ